MPNGNLARQPAGTGAFPPNRPFELSVSYVTGQHVMSLPLGDVGNSQDSSSKVGAIEAGAGHRAGATVQSQTVALIATLPRRDRRALHTRQSRGDRHEGVPPTGYRCLPWPPQWTEHDKRQCSAPHAGSGTWEPDRLRRRPQASAAPPASAPLKRCDGIPTPERPGKNSR